MEKNTEEDKKERKQKERAHIKTKFIKNQRKPAKK